MMVPQVAKKPQLVSHQDSRIAGSVDKLSWERHCCSNAVQERSRTTNNNCCDIEIDGYSADNSGDATGIPLAHKNKIKRSMNFVQGQDRESPSKRQKKMQSKCCNLRAPNDINSDLRRAGIAFRYRYFKGKLEIASCSDNDSLCMVHHIHSAEVTTPIVTPNATQDCRLANDYERLCLQCRELYKPRNTTMSPISCNFAPSSATGSLEGSITSSAPGSLEGSVTSSATSDTDTDSMESKTTQQSRSSVEVHNNALFMSPEP